jgi:hypothetical protein
VPSNYPAGADSFNEPSLPEETTLSSAGTGTRNHPEHHRDLGDAIEAIEANAALMGHDHSGDPEDIHKGPKLTQANTHQSPDTDDADDSLHHTLGTGAHQASKGNHTHSYNDLSDVPFKLCTSTTRPSSPPLGMLIYETDTFRLRSWAQYPVDNAPYWHYLLGPLPTCRLRQGFNQQLLHTGTILEWHQELEDSALMFDQSVSATNIVIKETGQYAIAVGVQWDPELVPDVAYIWVLVNGVATDLRQSQFMRGNLYTPGFSQTISTSGNLRLQYGDIIQVMAAYQASGSILNQIFSHFDAPSQINSRIDVVFTGT